MSSRSAQPRRPAIAAAGRRRVDARRDLDGLRQRVGRSAGNPPSADRRGWRRPRPGRAARPARSASVAGSNAPAQPPKPGQARERRADRPTIFFARRAFISGPVICHDHDRRKGAQHASDVIPEARRRTSMAKTPTDPARATAGRQGAAQVRPPDLGQAAARPRRRQRRRQPSPLSPSRPRLAPETAAPQPEPDAASAPKRPSPSPAPNSGRCWRPCR